MSLSWPGWSSRSCSRAAVPARVRWARCWACSRGRPAATAPSARASATRATKAGPEEVRARKASSWPSGSSITSPTRANSPRTHSRRRESTPWPQARPVRPERTRQGVLGTARTQAHPGKRASRRSSLTPANTESSRGRSKGVSPSGPGCSGRSTGGRAAAATASSCWGFTASSTVEQPQAATGLVLTTKPWASASCRAEASLATAARTATGAITPSLIRGSSRAWAIRPKPTMPKEQGAEASPASVGAAASAQGIRPAPGRAGGRVLGVGGRRSALHHGG